MAFEDKTLVCKECGKEFTFTAGEQEFYAEKGFENEPARCRDCRDKRRRTRDGGEQRQMFKVTCADCGKETEVRAPEITEAIEQLRLKRFRKDGYTLYIYGICSTCQATITRQKKKTNKQDKE